MKLKIFFLTAVVTCLASLSLSSHSYAQPIHQDIIDGTLVPVSQFPYVAQMDLDGYVCTGTLVGTKYVLSAGHCFFDENHQLKDNVSKIGAILNGTYYKAAKVTVHPSYVNRNSACVDGETDAAIMELESEPPNITPIPLQRTAPTEGTSLLLVGFGTQGTGSSGENDTFPADGYVNYGSTTIESVDNSYVAWKFNSHSGEANTAGGDSGGPAFSDVDGVRYINSITCGGTGNAGFNTYSYNSRADVFADWVDSIVGTSPPTTAPSFTSLTAQTATVNKLFSYAIAVSGTAPVAVSAVGDLPPGLSLSGTTISGYPTTAGTYTITLSASNSIGSASGSFTIAVSSKEVSSTLTIDKVTINFVNENADLVAIRGKVVVGNKFTPKKSSVKVTMASSKSSFALNSIGAAVGKSGGDTAKLIGKLSKGKFTTSRVKFYIGLGDSSSLYTNLDTLLSADAADGDQVTLPLKITIKKSTYDGAVTVQYNASTGLWVSVN